RPRPIQRRFGSRERKAYGKRRTLAGRPEPLFLSRSGAPRGQDERDDLACRRADGPKRAARGLVAARTSARMGILPELCPPAGIPGRSSRRGGGRAARPVRLPQVREAARAGREVLAAMSGVPSLSLIVAVYRRPDLLERIFTSLTNQSFPDF